MADDEKIIRIEGVLSDETAGKQQGSGSVPEQIRSTAEHDKLLEEKTRRESVEDILNKLTSGEDELLPGIKAEPAGAVSQMSAAEAFGKDSEFNTGVDGGRKAAAADSNDINGLISQFAKFNAAQPAGGTAAAGAAGAGGGAAGGIAGAGAAGAGAGGANLAAAATSAGSALSTLGYVTLGVVTTYTLFTAALTTVTTLLDEMFESLARRWKDISGQMQAAEAMQNVELLQNRLQTEQQVGGAAAAVTNSQTEFYKDIQEIKAAIVVTMAPILIGMYTILKVLFWPIKKAAEAILYIAQIVSDAWTWIKNKFGIQTPDPKADSFEQEFENMIVGSIGRNNTIPPVPGRIHFPTPNPARTIPWDYTGP